MRSDRVSQIGDPIIRARAKKVLDPKSPATRRLIAKMTRAMRREHLVGIAAPQVGVGLRIFITEPRSTKFRTGQLNDRRMVFINPRITIRSKAMQSAYEGCGSVAQAGIFGMVPRSTTITIRAQDERGVHFKFQATGFLARIIQHEYDHLNGMVFLDRVKQPRSIIGRENYLRRLKQRSR